MSLHQLAHHVQSAGRGEDKVLVHMTPKEVSGLQALAMAHGGSLTVNPQTGLPEAGFLSSLLPMLAGGALTVMSGGVINPLTAGLLVGAAGTVATGSLGKGLMMGLGAYGGAGLGAGLTSMGTTAQAATTAGTTTGTTASATPTLFPSSANAAGAQASTLSNVAKGTGQFPSFVPQPNLPVSLSPTVANAQLAANAVPTQQFTGAMISPNTLGNIGAGVTAPPSTMSTLGAGFKQATSGIQGLKDLYAASEVAAPYGLPAAAGSAALSSYYDKLGKAKPPKQDVGLIRPYTYERQQVPGAYDMGAPMYAETPGSSAERNYFTDQYTALTPYKAPGPEYAAEGGIMGLAVGGPVEQMSADNAIGGNTMYPQSQLQTPMYSNPMMQRPMPTDVIQQGLNMPVNTYTGEQRFAKGGATAEPQTTGSYQYSYNPQTMQFTQTAAPTPKPATDFGPFNLVARAIAQGVNAQQPPTTPVGTTSGGMAQPMPTQSAQPAYTPPPSPAYQTPEQQLGLTGFYPMMEQRLAALGAAQGYAGGGLSHLGDYSDGGRLLKGPGDGVSDSIPAVIGERQPARLADGEFVVPARIVSELGNGSTEAGARKLYAMMDRVQKARSKTVGKNKVAANTKSEKYLPA